jgi:hypothetical protein
MRYLVILVPLVTMACAPVTESAGGMSPARHDPNPETPQQQEGYRLACTTPFILPCGIEEISLPPQERPQIGDASEALEQIVTVALREPLSVDRL